MLGVTRQVLTWVAIAQAAIAFILVVITFFYLMATKKMAGEMNASRMLSVTPMVAVDLQWLYGFNAFVRVSNTGLGPALDVDLQMTLDPTPGSGRDELTFPWRWKLLAPGDQHRWWTPFGSPVHSLVKSYDHLRVEGTVRDMLGNTHPVKESLDFVHLLETEQRGFPGPRYVPYDEGLRPIAIQLERLADHFAPYDDSEEDEDGPASPEPAGE